MRKSNELRRKRNMSQAEEQNQTQEKKNEMEVSNLPERVFIKHSPNSWQEQRNKGKTSSKNFKNICQNVGKNQS